MLCNWEYRKKSCNFNTVCEQKRSQIVGRCENTQVQHSKAFSPTHFHRSRQIRLRKLINC